MFPKQDMIWFHHGDKNVEKRGPVKLMVIQSSEIKFDRKMSNPLSIACLKIIPAYEFITLNILR